MGRVDYKMQRAEILSRLDLIAELKALGVRLAAEQPDPSGWLKCHAIDREDATASAAIAVCAHGPEAGFYRDHATGRKMSFFDLAVACGKHSDWKAALQDYGRQTGVISAPKSLSSPGTLVAEYVYRDEHGQPVIKAIRYQNEGEKTFRQMSWRDGVWQWGTQGVNAPPYCLPELLATEQPGSVWIAEGEKDVHRLQTQGLVASCNIGGAGKFKSDLAKWFTGYDVILLADNDQAGEDHVLTAAKHLHGVAASVRIVRFPELPNKGDVSDFLDQGGTLGELRRRAAEAEEWKPSGPVLSTTGRFMVERADEQGREHFTDLRNAELFIEQHGENVRYCFTWRSWLIWDGTRWKSDQTNQVFRLAKSVFEYWSNQRGALSGTDLGKQIIRHSERSASARGIESFLKLAAAHVPILTDDMNRDPWLFNCPNGTIDLRTGQLREHRREDFLTTLCPTAFNADADSLVWDSFLESTFADHGDVIPFLQRLLGSSLVGMVRDHVLPICHGSGANGKSVLLTIIIAVLGQDYAMQAVPDMLMDSDGEKHPTERADLFGKRFVAAIETEQGRRLKEAMVKSLTGGDRIRARRLYQDFFEFEPSHLIVMCTNHRPRVTGDDKGIWRRLRLIPFDQTFDGPRCDPRLTEKLQGEREGILSWLVKGCLDWQAQGLNEPATVLQATESYRSDSDVVGQFISECCYVNEGMQVKFADLFEALEAWCKEAGENVPSRHRVGKTLLERFSQVPQVRGRWYKGLGLKD